MTNFNSFELPEFLQTALQDLHITTPTPVQEKAIPAALQKRDILASAQTGTGKTLAFTLPVLTHLVAGDKECALILTPTRELAMQIRDTIKSLFAKHMPFDGALLIGGDSMTKQFAQLRRNPRIVVGTPGRIADHLRRGTLNLSNTHFLILDEADRMMDMGFGDELDAIVEELPENRQTLMFSATIARNIANLAKKYLLNPEIISINPTSKPADKIKQEVIETTASGKFTRLLKELETRDGSIIVFVKTKRGAANLAERLQDENHEADAIHGDLRQRERDQVMRAFKMGKSRIMVATDIAARGLDIPQIRHVINYELPQCPEDYIHRIGRTARAGAEGNALCLVAPSDKRQWEVIRRSLDPTAKKSENQQNHTQRPSRNKSGRPRWNKDYSSSSSAGPRPPTGGQRRSFPSGSSASGRPSQAGEQQRPGHPSQKPRLQRSKKPQMQFGKPKSKSNRRSSAG